MIIDRRVCNASWLVGVLDERARQTAVDRCSGLALIYASQGRPGDHRVRDEPARILTDGHIPSALIDVRKTWTQRVPLICAGC